MKLTDMDDVLDITDTDSKLVYGGSDCNRDYEQSVTELVASNMRSQDSSVSREGKATTDSKSLPPKFVTGAHHEETNQAILGAGLFGYFGSKFKGDPESVLDYCQILREMQPQNALEGMIYNQLLVLHMEGMRQVGLGKSSFNADTEKTHINSSVKLFRQFDETIKSLQRLRGNFGRQEVTVKHVSVNATNAIVGDVNKT